MRPADGHRSIKEEDMVSRFAQWVVVLIVVVLGGCRGDEAAPSGGSEFVATATEALTAGAGSVGSCAGNPRGAPW